ncbi:MAG: molybdopterin-guanine dinucleotide biosynthesis protein B [Gammaproteobacteria bacterium]|nr:molybdopterin-guanine dinucleotide biosynthesis protein B [Gammaproteobacteria bacterium]
MPTKSTLPVLGFVAYSGTGKTTLLVKLIPVLKDKGLRVGIIKYTHHQVEIDQPGKDSFRLRKSGATQTLLASNSRWALITENEQDTQLSLDDMVSRLDSDLLDIALIEGYKKGDFPKIELHRTELNNPLFYPNDDSIIAIASDEVPLTPDDLPVLDINQPEEIANFIISTFFQTPPP